MTGPGSEPLPELPQSYQIQRSDHDTLIRLGVQMDTMREDLQHLKHQVGSIHSAVVLVSQVQEAQGKQEQRLGKAEKDIDALWQRVRERETQLRLLLWIGTPVAALAIGIVSTLVQQWLGI